MVSLGGRGKAAVNNLGRRSKPLFTSEGIDRLLGGGFAPAGRPRQDNEAGLCCLLFLLFVRQLLLLVCLFVCV